MAGIVRISLDTSDFSVWVRPDGRIAVQIDGPTDTVELDMTPEVAQDLMISFIDPNPED